MGVYLSTAQTDMESEEGSNEYMKYCVGEIQGWRRNMEDAHIASVDLASHIGVSTSKKMALFGVFDGHGGKEVAKFVQIKLLRELINTKSFKEDRFRYIFYTI